MSYRSVTPRVVVADPAAAVAFLVAVFAATATTPEHGPAEIRLGDSLVLVSGVSAELDEFPAFLYVYIADVAGTYARALAHCATSVEALRETSYGDFGAMGQDPSGNVFQLSARKA
ncbi:VOC family protein [Amycolatopsis sp. FDAARGOS 1241]|uniref:VOC family protein n=1 Tax=Amycolatopsis sp. FDAARGOS 1241 TaxID=2778070 RepID=UPI0019512221|nr:VOC family protein [Amycolatopsis sp. FDAARGOS 1241]QRP47595.1 VOC family protein [Amycolatopsis sp. FDAARGOS 1241]